MVRKLFKRSKPTSPRWRAFRTRVSLQSWCTSGPRTGPLLFTLYIRSLPDSVGSSCLLLADDILLYCSSKNPDEIAAKLSSDVTKLHKWLGIRGLTMNVQKTKAMFVYPSRHDNLSADIEVECCGRPLDIVKSYKYLGVMLDSDLN